MARLPLSSFAEIKHMLTGGRFGAKNDSTLSTLVARISKLKQICEVNRDSLDRWHVQEFESLRDLAFELQLGGSCEHGADKGPQCRYCRGALKGRYAQRETGVEVIDYMIAHTDLSSKERDRLMVECDRISDALKEAQADLKKVDTSLNHFRRKLPPSTKNPLVKRSKGPVDQEMSLEEIKKEIGLNAEALAKSHDVLRQELKSAKFHLRFRCEDLEDLNGEVLISQADLEAEHDQEYANAFEWVKVEIVKKISAQRGISIRFGGMRSKTCVVFDTESLQRAFELNVVEDEVFFLTDSVVIEHESYLECFKRTGGNSQLEEGGIGSIFINRLKDLPNDCQELNLSCIRSIPAALFDSIWYRQHLRCLNLSCSRFSWMSMARAVSTLPSLSTLILCTSSPSYSKDGTSLQELSGAFEFWSTSKPLRELETFDLSGHNLVTSDEAVFRSFSSFLMAHPHLKELKLNRCFWIQRGAFVEDDASVAVSQFISNSFVSSLPRNLNLLSFIGNAFTDTPSVSAFINGMLTGAERQQLRTLILTESRTWSCFVESEDENEEGNNDERSVIKVSSLDEHQGIGFAFRSVGLNSRDVDLGGSLTSLGVASCRIGNEGLAWLVQCASVLKHLENLDISNVGASFSGLQALFKGIAVNVFPNLAELSVSWNDPDCFALTSDLKTTLRDALIQSKELKQLEIIGYRGLSPSDLIGDGIMLQSLVFAIPETTLTRAILQPIISSTCLANVFLWGASCSEGTDILGSTSAGWNLETFSRGASISAESLKVYICIKVRM